MHVASLRAGVLLALAAISLTACGSGGSTLLTQPPPPVATFPVPAAAQNSAVVPVGAAASTQALPATGGITPTLSLPAASASTSLNVVVASGSATAALNHSRSVRGIAGPLPPSSGPYLVELAFTASQTVTLQGAIGASFDIGPYLNANQQLALAYLASANASFYAGIQDSNGVFTTAGPLSVNGTVVTYLGPAQAVTLVAGSAYRIGVRLNAFPAAPSPSPSPTSPAATPTPAPTATPTAVPTATPTPVPTATPTPVPTATPTPVPTATPPSTASGQINSAGATVDPVAGTASSGALILPNAGGFGGAVGYSSNDSAVASFLTQSFNGFPQGAPSPPQGKTVDYAVRITLNSGPPNNQAQLNFNAASGSIAGYIDIPFATSSTYTVYLYAPAFNATQPIYTSQSVAPSPSGSGSRLTFTSPISSIHLPLPQTLYVYFTRP